MDISKYFSEFLGIRDDESRLYVLVKKAEELSSRVALNSLVELMSAIYSEFELYSHSSRSLDTSLGHQMHLFKF